MVRRLHHDTDAFELVFNGTKGMSRARKEKADCWITGERSFRMEVVSQSVRLPDGTVLSVVSLA